MSRGPNAHTDQAVFDWSYWGYGSAFALIAWIPFSLWRFSRVRPTVAAAQVLIWGMMWLPEGAAFDLPALPPFSKYTISAVSVLVGLLWKGRDRLRAARIGRGYDLLIGMMILAQIGTVLTNADALHYGSWKTIDIPGFTPYDGISAAVRVLLQVGLPCVLGRALLRSERDVHDLLETLAVAGVVYSLPILFELRMSPVLHDMVYGYAPRTDWSQNLRAGGYRPTAFMGHGLVVGFFMFLCTTAAVTLQKAGRKRLLGQPITYVVGYLCVILLLCKAAAPIIYAAVGFIVVQYLSAKGQARVLTALGLIVLSYPMTRILDVFPVEGILSMAGALGPERVQSLQFRFDNEDILLLKGAERLWFGWGGYGRERVFDPETAKDLVIQDGQWIVVFGQSGLVGFVAYFSTLLLPVWQLARGLKRVVGRSERSLLAGFGFCVVACAVNMLPNMPLPYLQFMFASGLVVALSGIARQGSRPAPARSVRPSKSVSVRPSRGAPLRPVWYGTPPPGAYAADMAPRAAPEASSQPVRVAPVAEQERSQSVQTVVIRAVSERPTMVPPAPEAGADLTSPDLAGDDAGRASAEPAAAARRSDVVPVSAAARPGRVENGMAPAAAGGEVSAALRNAGGAATSGGADSSRALSGSPGSGSASAASGGGGSARAVSASGASGGGGSTRAVSAGRPASAAGGGASERARAEAPPSVSGESVRAAKRAGALSVPPPASASQPPARAAGSTGSGSPLSAPPLAAASGRKRPARPSAPAAAGSVPPAAGVSAPATSTASEPARAGALSGSVSGRAHAGSGSPGRPLSVPPLAASGAAAPSSKRPARPSAPAAAGSVLPVAHASAPAASSTSECARAGALTGSVPASAEVTATTGSISAAARPLSAPPLAASGAAGPSSKRPARRSAPAAAGSVPPAAHTNAPGPSSLSEGARAAALTGSVPASAEVTAGPGPARARSLSVPPLAAGDAAASSKRPARPSAPASAGSVPPAPLAGPPDRVAASGVVRSGELLLPQPLTAAAGAQAPASAPMVSATPLSGPSAPPTERAPQRPSASAALLQPTAAASAQHFASERAPQPTAAVTRSAATAAPSPLSRTGASAPPVTSEVPNGAGAQPFAASAPGPSVSARSAASSASRSEAPATASSAPGSQSASPPPSAASASTPAVPGMSAEAQAVARAMAGLSKAPRSAPPTAASISQPAADPQISGRTGALPPVQPSNDVTSTARSSHHARLPAGSHAPASGHRADLPPTQVTGSKPAPANDVPSADELNDSEPKPSHSVPPPPPRAA